MSKLHTSIAQWGLVSGIRQDASDLIVVAPFPSQFSPEARKGQLIVVVEAEGDVSRGRNACTLVANTIQETFYGDRAVSITSSLRKALKAANAALYQFNFEAPPHKRATLGVTCAVIHGAHLFIAQVHPAQAYVVHAGKLRALPNPLAWSGGAQGGAAVGHSTALGTSLGSEPEFYREVLQAGDTVVLAASNVARILGKSQAEQLFAFGDAPAIADGLYELCRRNHLPESHAIAVEMTPELSAAAREAPLSAAGVGERSKLAVEHLSGWVASRVGGRRQGEQADEAPDVTTPGPTDWAEYEQHPLAVQSSALHSREATAPIAAQSTVAVPGVVPGSLLDRVPVGDPDVLPLSAFLGEGEYGGIVRPPAIKRERQIDLGDNTGTPMDFAALPRKAQQPPTGMVEQATMPLRSAVVHMLGGMANRRRRTTMDVQPRAPRTKVRGLSYRRERPPFPWVNLVVLLVVVVLIAGVGIQLNRNQDQAIINRAFGAVETAVAAAENATADADAQQRLIDAERALNNLDTLKANGQLTPEKTAVWDSYQQLLLRYDQARSTINRIGVLSDLAPLVTLPSPNGLVSRVVLGVDADTVGALQENRVYVLDRGNDSGVLYERAPDGTLTPLLSPGQTVGSLNAGSIRDVLWRGDNPMALDRDDNPFSAFATSFLRTGDGWLANRLNGTELMPLGDLPATSYGGNLYLWDSEKQQLMRYASGQYGDLPTEWITNRGDADLSNVVGVQIDGNVNLLRGDGSVVIFTDGAYQRTLPPPTLTPPVKNITRFFVTPDQIDPASGTVVAPGSIFLLDTLNERVIEVRKEDGSEVQQIVARDAGQLSQLADLQVDVVNRQIYLANGNEVYRARLPDPPAN
jgi:hypothetical protein